MSDKLMVLETDEQSLKKMRLANRNEGHVYVLLSENGLIKIGVSQNPTNRAAQIQSMSGYKIKKAFYTEKCWNPYHIEKAMHKVFNNFRRCGEWFECSYDDAVSTLKNVFSLIAVFENNAPKSDTNGATDLIGIFLGVEQYDPHREYATNTAEKIVELSAFHSCPIDIDFFTAEIEMYKELEETEEIHELQKKYPCLFRGEYDQAEFECYVEEVYNTLFNSGLCSLGLKTL